jgi:hypothetical protein
VSVTEVTSSKVMVTTTCLSSLEVPKRIHLIGHPPSVNAQGARPFAVQSNLQQVGVVKAMKMSEPFKKSLPAGKTVEKCLACHALRFLQTEQR